MTSFGSAARASGTATSRAARQTAAGVGGGFAVVPSPICPELPRPQHLTLPAAVSAHVKLLPPASAVASVMPTTSTTVVRARVVPSPSWPLELMPQHFTAPD